MKRNFFGVALPLAAFALWSTPAFAQDTTRSAKMVAVPVKAPVALDGDLAEWDWSGALQSAYESALAPKFSAQFAFQYDGQNLYFGAKIHDDSPLQNMHDARVEPDNGWNGDAVQLRLTAAPEMAYPLKASVFDLNTPEAKDPRIVHLTMWNFSPKNESSLTIHRSMNFLLEPIVTGEKTGVAYKKWADEKGYNIEARFPWTMLGVKDGQKPPTAGDQVALTIQTLWSSPDGIKQILSYNDVIRGAGFHFQTAENWGQLEFLAKGDIAPALKPLTGGEVQLPLAFSLPIKDSQAKKLSVGIWNSKNELVRTLPTLADFKLQNGRANLRWDGLDDDGRVLPAGTYNAKFLTHRGIDTKWLTSLNSPGSPPWKTGDGTGAWGGDHGMPLAAASDGQNVYLGWKNSEAGFALVKTKSELKADRFGQAQPQKLWGAQSNLDVGLFVQGLASNGEFLFVAQDGKQFLAYADPNAPNIGGVLLQDAKTGRPVNFPFGKRVLKISEGKIPDGADKTRLNVFAIAVAGDDLFVSLYHDNQVLRYNWKTGEQTAKWDVDSPRGLGVGADGVLRLLSKTNLIKINPQSGKRNTLATGLADPYGLAIAPDGVIFVSDRGASQQVKVFDVNGKALPSIGKAGGRAPMGRWDASGMLQPAGLTVDKDGKIWVTEEGNAPRRVSVWNRAGKLLADILGPGWYAVEGYADTRNPRRVATSGVLFDVDYATGKTKTLGVPVAFDRNAPRLNADGTEYEFHHVKGRTYLSQRGTALYLLDEKTLVARPVAAIGRVVEFKYFFGVTPEMFPAAERAHMNELMADANTNLIWTDRNGDGLMQGKEWIKSQATETPSLYWGGVFDEDLTLWSAGAYSSGKVYKVPVQKFLPDGTPDYGDLADLKPIAATRGTKEIQSVLPSLDRKSFYSVESAGANTEYQALTRYKLDGTPRWSYRRTWIGFALTSPLYRPGMVIGAQKLIGVEPAPGAPVGNEIVGVNGYHGQFYLLTGDGLFIDAMGSDNRYSPENSEKTYFVENFSGTFFRNKENGKYYLIAGETDTRISEITGLETIQNAQMTLAISDADATRARVALASRSTQSGGPGVLLMRPMTPDIDGALTEWKLPEVPQIDGDGGRTAKVGVGYDAQNLYLAFEVRDGSPLKNAGGDEALLFKSGDSVNFNLSTNAAADVGRSKPVAGDLRILITETNEGPIAVLYEPVASAGTVKTPRNFTSTTGAEVFERVLKIEGARIAVTRNQLGYYQLEAAIPLAALNFKPQAGQSYKGDAGVLFSTPAGNTVGLRAYIFNKDTQVTQDIPTEARLEPGKWGMVKVE